MIFDLSCLVAAAVLGGLAWLIAWLFDDGDPLYRDERTERPRIVPRRLYDWEREGW